MRVGDLGYRFDKVSGEYRPTLYPGESADGWEVPEGMGGDFRRLSAMIEGKYSIEYLKVCAFYNKMFPSLKAGEWSSASYNARPYTWLDQERSDTGTGMSSNYLKQIVDQVTSRLGTVQFVPYLMSEDKSFEYVVYKDEVERILRMYSTRDGFNRVCMEVFHDAAVLGYSYVFIDPWTGRLVKASDYEVGIFESQLNRGRVEQMLYRDYACPAHQALVYLEGLDGGRKAELLERMSGRVSVDLCLYFNSLVGECFATVDGMALPARDYPFGEVLVAVMRWDTGFSAVTGSSLFDTLYPLQREINKINAKQQQLVRNYKGATPVFNADVELAMKSITNGAGECLYVDSQRPLDSLMTVINPTPIDPELSGIVQEYKGAMYELAGIQNASFDMENMRSAAAVVALDQTRDSVFQAQLSALSDFIAKALTLYVRYNARRGGAAGGMDWESVERLLDTAYISLKPVHLNDPLSDEAADRGEVDYVQLCVARCVMEVVRGRMTFATLPYYVDWQQVTLMVAATLVKFEALGVGVPDSVHEFLVSAFVESVRLGEVAL